MTKKDSQTNKTLLAVIAVLIAGLVYLGLQVHSLQKEVALLSAREYPVQAQLPPQRTTLPRNVTGPQQHGISFEDDWDPFAEIRRIQEEMNRMFRDSFGRGQAQFGLFNEQIPFDLETDIRETESGYIIKMDIPGMEKANINVEVKGQTLLVSGKKDELNEAGDQQRFYKRERNFGYFSRAVPLPADADASAITAEYEKGVLTVKIAKKEGAEKESLQKVDVQ